MIGWVVGAVLTVWILWGPVLPFGVHSPRGHLFLHTVDLCVALLAGYLAFLRFLRARRVSDLLLAQSLFALALGTAAGLALYGREGNVELWLPVTIRVAASVVLLCAAVVGPGRTAGRGGARWVSLATVGLLVVGAVAAWRLGPVLPVGMAGATGEDIDRVHPELLAAHPVLIATYLISAVCLSLIHI